jgi:hypothetical protein
MADFILYVPSVKWLSAAWNTVVWKILWQLKAKNNPKPKPFSLFSFHAKVKYLWRLSIITSLRGLLFDHKSKEQIGVNSC